MHYKFFTNSEKTWTAMYEAIEGAKESVYLEMYIVEDNMPAQFDFLTLLKEKARNGVRVRMILDSFGSGTLKEETVSSLREAGAELFFASEFLHRVHRKILIVDENVAFLGGVNFQPTSRRWNDLSVKIRGRRMVSSLIRSFARVYAESGGKDALILQHAKKLFLDKRPSSLVENFPISNKFGFKKIYKEHLRDAKESILLITPYFAPKRWFIALLDQAHLRGIKVEILIPRNTDISFVDRMNYFYMVRVARLGVQIYLESQMNHAKAMIIDKKEAMIGSQNLDIISFDLNSEVGIFFKEPYEVAKLCAIAQEWKSEAVLFDPKTYKPKWFDYIFAPLFHIFYTI